MPTFEVTLKHWTADGENDDAILWVTAPDEERLELFLAAQSWAEEIDRTVHPPINLMVPADGGVDFIVDEEGHGTPITTLGTMMQREERTHE